MKLKHCLPLLVISLALQANAYNSWLVRGRLGKLELKSSLPSKHLDCTKLRDGYFGEIALTKLFTPYIGVELGGGLAFVQAKKR